MKQNHFPLFLPSEGRRVLVVGGGKIATRRVQALLQFQFSIQVITLTVTPLLEELGQSGFIHIHLREPKEEDFRDIFFCLLATDKPTVNEYWGSYAKSQGILTNQAHDKSLCDFYFPAFIHGEDFVMGLVGDGSSHKKVKELRERIESALDGAKETGQNPL